MNIKTPHFWYRAHSTKAPLQEHLLAPFSWLYSKGHIFLQAQKTKEAKSINIPVFCVGNLVAGGSGKTPIAIALMELLRERKIFNTPYFLTRGYKGQEKGPLLVDYFHHNAKQVGDESLLLAKTGYTILAADRYLGACHARDLQADALIMDDGLQNPRLIKDINFAVIDGSSGFGNEKTLPSGPLRENLAQGFQRTDAFIIIGKDKHSIKQKLPSHKPVFFAHMEANEKEKPPTVKKYLAFAGLGKPEKFYHLLQKLGYNICEFQSFPDHYLYSKKEIQELMSAAKRQDAELITTEKDFMRITENHINTSHSTKINVLPVQISWENKDELLRFMVEKLEKSQTQQSQKQKS